MNAILPQAALDRGWLLGLLNGPAWPAALPLPEEARRQRALAQLPLEALLPPLERASREGRRALSIVAYQAWLGANPGHPQALAAWFNLGVEFSQAGEPAQAVICYRNALARADQVGATTVSFPAIPTGIFGYPLDAATDIAVDTVRSTPTSVATVRFVCFDDTTLRVYRDRLAPVT